MKRIFFAVLVAVLFLAPVLIFATDSNEQPPALIKNVAGLCTAIRNIVNVVFGLLMIIAVFYILLAAFNYLTAQGNTEKIAAANKQLTSAVIAVVIGVLAWSIPVVVASALYKASDNADQSAGIFSCGPAQTQ